MARQGDPVVGFLVAFWAGVSIWVMVGYAIGRTLGWIPDHPAGLGLAAGCAYTALRAAIYLELHR